MLEVLRSKRLFRYYGPTESDSKVKQLEDHVSEAFGARHTLALSSGGMALAAGLAALGIGPGDEVIVPAYTWIATAAAVLLVGAVPVIAEVDDALTLDPADAESRITSRTAALVPVHMPRRTVQYGCRPRPGITARSPGPGGRRPGRRGELPGQAVGDDR